MAKLTALPDYLKSIQIQGPFAFQVPFTRYEIAI